MNKIFQSPLLLISGFCLLSTVAVADAGYEIRRTVSTENETLSLADLIDGKGLPDTPIFRAPAPGENGTIKVARVLSAARKLSLEIDGTRGLEEIFITRKSREVTEDDIRSALEQNLAKISGSTKFEFMLDPADKSRARNIESTAVAPVEIRSLKLDKERTRFQALAVVSDSPLLLRQPVELSGTFTPLNLVYVAARDIERGTVLGEADFREEFRPLGEAGESTPPKYTVPRGMVLKRDVKSGEPIPATDLVAEIQVEKNASILVRYERAGLTISMRGKALQSGAMGEVISVMNPQSKKAVDAIIIGKGRVLAKPESATNVASATN